MAKAKAAAKSSDKPGRPVKVRATRTGFYGLERRRVGDVFTIDGTVWGEDVYADKEKTEVLHAAGTVKAFSPEWMELVSASTPEHTTGAQAALDKENADLLGRKAGAGDKGGQGDGSELPTGNANPLGGE